MNIQSAGWKSIQTFGFIFLYRSTIVHYSSSQTQTQNWCVLFIRQASFYTSNLITLIWLQMIDYMWCLIKNRKHNCVVLVYADCVLSIVLVFVLWWFELDPCSSLINYFQQRQKQCNILKSMLQYAEDIVLIICFLIFQSLILSTAVPTIIGFSLWREVGFILFRNLWVKCLDAYKTPVFLQYCPRVLAELSDLHDFYDSDMVELISWIRWIIVSVIVIDEVGVVI